MEARRRPVIGLHHIELWVPDIEAAKRSWGWLLTELGWVLDEFGETTFSLALDDVYLFVEQSPALHGQAHDRLTPGVNHLAFHAGPRERVDELVGRAPGHGWTLLFPDRHPYAGGTEHYAAYLEDGHGYEVELVADSVD
jgi:catechol 2,3-dioxygenase-like lactoylglutathione lyase family enzyme